MKTGGREGRTILTGLALYGITFTSVP